ncbi:hypothetical protein ABZ467_35880 [Streptomyces sp. NPDC005727]|uniref:hypothetical protein n=1 Tax=Streptomyces sp. NPDC005727 TaxID=3157053 RepID=UPI0034049E29
MIPTQWRWMHKTYAWEPYNFEENDQVAGSKVFECVAMAPVSHRRKRAGCNRG